MIPTPPFSSSENFSDRVVILGASGMLGFDLLGALKARFSPANVFAPSRFECDLGNEKAGVEYLKKISPRYLVNAAAFANVDKAETERDAAFLANVSGPEWLARYCNGSGTKLLHFSTDQVFDGTKGTPYSEADFPNPVNYYAETKYLGEQTVLKNRDAVVMRVQWLYGRARDRFTPIRREAEFSAFVDQSGAPTWTEELCRWVMPLVSGESHGIFHMVHDDYDSWAEVYRFVIQTTGWATQIRETKTADAALPAKRPPFSVLSNLKLKNFLGVDSLGSYRGPLKRFLLQRA